jgi:hypothetical protein
VFRVVVTVPAQIEGPALMSGAFLLARTIWVRAACVCSVVTSRLRPQRGESLWRNQIYDPGRKGSPQERP